MSSVDTACPVCWESVHGEEPVGVLTGCGHVMHQSCYRDWQKKGEYVYESSSDYSRRNYKLNYNLNCLVCNQPTKSFVDLFIRLPPATKNHKDEVRKLEYEFHTVCRRTQLSLEKEIARRDFEQRWLKEERQVSQAARQKTEDRHKQVIRELNRNLRSLKKDYQHKMSCMEERSERRRSQRTGQNRHRSSQSTAEEALISPESSTEFTTSTSPESAMEFSVEDITETESHTELEEAETHAASEAMVVVPRNFIARLPSAEFSAAAAAAAVVTSTAELEENNTNNTIETGQSFTARLPSAAFAAAAAAALQMPTSSEKNAPDRSSQNQGSARQLSIGAADPESNSFQGLPDELPVAERASCQYTQSRTESDERLIDPENIDTVSANEVNDVAADGPVAGNELRAVTDLSESTSSLPTLLVTPPVATLHRHASLSPIRNDARGRRAVFRDTIFHPSDGNATAMPARGRRSVLRDEIFAPAINSIRPSQIPAANAYDIATSNQEEQSPAVAGSCEGRRESIGSTSTNVCCSSGKTVTATTPEEDRKLSVDPPTASAERDEARNDESEGSSVAEYELQRLQADSAFYQHQAELVEWERHQAEIELEQDELALRQREQRIRLERSRLEQSFTFIQRRVRESKREARDRQQLSAMEEKYAKYKLARSREEERYEQELQHLEQDEIHNQEREQCEKERQEKEKNRLKKELNELVKVKSKLEKEKELSAAAEEQTCSSQCGETCVVCFESLINDESELGVAVPCGHAFHCSCFNGWEKSKRRRGTPCVPCPLCNVPTSLCVAIRLNRPDCSLYCASSVSLLTKHFKKQEERWHRERFARLGGEMSS